MSRAERNRHALIEAMIDRYLQRAWSDVELAEELGTDRTNVWKIRTKVLEERMKIPIYRDDDGRYRINKEHFVANIRLTPAEALALYLGGRRLQQQTRTGQKDVANALRKVAEALRQPMMQQLVRAAEAVLDQEQDEQQATVMQVLVECWINGRRVRIQHRKPHGQLRTYTVSPYQLEPSVWGDGVYLIGESDYHNGLATFKVSRIERARATTEPFTIPDNFDSHALLKHAWGIWHADEAPVPVRLKFNKYVTPRVKESIWHPEQTIQDLGDEGCIWQAEIAEWKEMVWWVRGWGSDVEVLAPEALRASIEQHVLRLNRIYGLSVPKATPAIAHTRNNQGKRHPLVTHLQAVADIASQFATPLHASDLAYYLGLWHDLGKFHPDFQQYLLDAETGIRRRGPDHKAAGVSVAQEQKLGPVALLLQGHHGGLKNKSDLQRWYQHCQGETANALSIAHQALTFAPPEPPPLPLFAQQSAHSAEFFLRMIFSALVDADFLDTEAHFAPEKSARRGNGIDMATLWRRFADDQQRHFGDVLETTVNRSRKEIYDACIEAAIYPPGLFRLTVPTGGGKTRSGMAFALRHALEHGQRRVVVAVPYITITQQTAGVYRSIFNPAEDNEPVVLEHHSGTTERSDTADEYDPEVIWQRLTAENWDVPIIVTTTVQLFESLFANSPGRCRKLHRLANSVIILDEAQSLPAHLLDPILDVLRELCAHYGSTVVLSTATQPAFDTFAPFKELVAREIVPTPERHFQALKRIQYEWRIDRPLTWQEVASLMRTETQALAICNTKQDALDLLDAVNDPHALHLSTLLCGAHRSAVIKEVHRLLKAGEPCRLVATQVVEAGVDIDFPLVLRALGPLDSIVQAAGRANREGKLDSGRVIIFNPADGSLPPGAYKRATQTTQTILSTGPLDMHDPLTMQLYFKKLYQLVDTADSEGKIIQKKRGELDYSEVAQRFRMIEDDTVSVIITTYGDEEQQRRVASILQRLRNGAPPTRRLLRQLQPYTISLWKRRADKYLNQGFLSPQTSEGIPPGIWEWKGEYDPVRGLTGTDMNADKFVF